MLVTTIFPAPRPAPPPPPTLLEGDTDREKVVLMSFPDEAAVTAWAQSPEYLEISEDRHAGAHTV
ncbi:DUF1330 domain-containing protein, partial [Nocardia farcinica]|uniref:DUF1330 domain-containing protein n=1 Tax=Nocardia farcinica TaxID=37329 RepID=UPI00245389C9